MRMEDHAKMVSLDTTVLVNKDLHITIFQFSRSNKFSIFHILTTVLRTHVRMEDHAKMVSLDTTVLVNKDLLGTIVKQVCINTLCFYLIASFDL